MLTFSTTDDHLLIGGKTFYIKESLRSLGAKWRKESSCWALCIFLDNEDLRAAMLGDAKSAHKAIKQQERQKRKAQKTYEESPEGIEAAAEAERQRIRWCFEQKQKTGAYWWLCCAECTVIHWKRRHTSCMKCAEWDGYCWNSFRVNGSIFTGD